MTLLTTEVHRSADSDVVVFAADRRISRGTFHAGSKPKVLKLPSHRAGIGYFGLAEVPCGSGRQSMADWLQDFLYTLDSASDLGRTATQLAEALNSVVPADWRREEASGFHLAGLGRDGRAEFWYVRNVDDEGRVAFPEYQVREDFRSRDGVALAPGSIWVYRNGDIRAHVAAWGKIDESLGALLGAPSFRPLVSIEDYVDWVRFKMHLIAEFYARFATESIIGEPVDVFAISARL